MEAATSHNVLTLPDTDGTVIMTGNLPDTLPFLTVLDRVDILHGSTILGASSRGGAHITLGAGVEHSSLWLHHTLSGRFPLQFSGLPAPDGRDKTNAQAADHTTVVSDEETDDSDGGPSLQIQITPSPNHNVITLPDSSGTVITTGNIEPLCALPYTPVYRMHAKNVQLASTKMVVFGAQASQLLQRQTEQSETSCSNTRERYPGYASPPPAGVDEGESANGIFAFLDSSHTSEPSSNKMPKLNANEFFVRAHGGVRLVSGVVQRTGGRSPLEIGVQIPPKGSGWSVLSDRNSKINISRVDDLWMLETIVKVPVSTWQYKGSPEGVGVTHMGPMAQDLNAALAPLNLGKSAENVSMPGEAEDSSRILTSDADGVLMSATRGMMWQIASQKDAVGELDEEVELLMARLQANNMRIQRNAAAISRHHLMLSSLESAMSLLS